MIQRIQSVYLFLAFVLDCTIFFNALYNHAQVDPVEWIGIGFTAVLALACLTSLLCIFLYPSRKIQTKIAAAAIFFQVIAFGYGTGILLSLGGFGMFLWDETVGAVLLLIALAATVMARKKIRSDQKLVQSMDRIR